MQIQYPKVEFKIRSEKEGRRIWDAIRRLWVVLTPEEWVRQNFLQYLVLEKKYPSYLMAIEKGIELNGLQKRCDIVVFKDNEPWMIVECKEPNVVLSQDTFMQIIRYNMVLQVPYLVITNGSDTMGWKIADNEIEKLDWLPAW